MYENVYANNKSYENTSNTLNNFYIMYTHIHTLMKNFN